MFKRLILLTILFSFPFASADLLEEADTAYEAGNLEMAKLKYEAAIAYDRKAAKAYLGVARIQYELGNQDEAAGMIKTGMRYDREKQVNLDLKALAIRVEDARGNPRAAKRHYRNAKKVRGYKDHPEVHVALAHVYMKERDFEKAQDLLELALASKSAYGKEAEHLLSNLQQIEKAIAVTDSAFAYDASITKAEVAQLLMHDLEIGSKVDADTSETTVGETSDQGLTDYAASSYKDAIVGVHRLGLRSFKIKNGAFEPEHAMTRVDLALLIEDVLHAKYNVSRTMHIGKDSPFGDLSSNHTGFNAMMTAVTRGLLQGNQDGNVRPDELVSGAEAILVLHNLDNILNEKV